VLDEHTCAYSRNDGRLHRQSVQLALSTGEADSREWRDGFNWGGDPKWREVVDTGYKCTYMCTYTYIPTYRHTVHISSPLHPNNPRFDPHDAHDA
jgi:hypothetical protein